MKIASYGGRSFAYAGPSNWNSLPVHLIQLILFYCHLATYTLKNIIMESLYKLKQAERKFKGVVVAHDMTRAERDECKKMVGEAKALEEEDTSGEYLYLQKRG